MVAAAGNPPRAERRVDVRLIDVPELGYRADDVPPRGEICVKTAHMVGGYLGDAEKRSKQDQSLRGYKRLLLSNPEEGERRVDAIIKNTYRTLMTRGMKGCYVYFTDKETAEYFSSLLIDSRQHGVLAERDVGV